MNFSDFRRSGHMPTLLTSFFFFDVCFAVWVLNGAMSPFVRESFSLTPAQNALLVSMPILSGALLRLPMGILAQNKGRKNVSLLIMALVAAALLAGWRWADSYQDMLVTGVLLGVGGASFGIALSLGSGWFPPKYKGLAMGIAGAGNSGTALSALFGPLLAARFGWQAVFGFALLPLAAAFIALACLAKEPPDASAKSLKGSLSLLAEKDTWTFNLLYVVTFGGFIGLTSFLPTFFHEQYGADKVLAGKFTALVVLMGSVARVAGGYVSDRWGGLRTLEVVLAFACGVSVLAGFMPPLAAMTALLILLFAALGLGNGAVFQLVPLRYPAATAVASSVIGEVGALGGVFVPNAMALSQNATGGFRLGFAAFAVLAALAFTALSWAKKGWTLRWVGDGGRVKAPDPLRPVVMVPAMDIY
jgi:MFS transporter, NNP family, nitrate/nitrite transporter